MLMLMLTVMAQTLHKECGCSGSGASSQFLVDQATCSGYQTEGCTPLHSYQLHHQGSLQLLEILQLLHM